MFRSTGTLSIYGPPVPTSLADLVDHWTVDDVVQWLCGIDESVVPYVGSVRAAGVTGRRLLGMTAGDFRLPPLDIRSVGVRQIIIQSVDLLMQLCHNMETENLQWLAMHVSVSCGNLLRQLTNTRVFVSVRGGGDGDDGEQRCLTALNTIVTNVSYVVDDAKRIISWLDRSPFDDKAVFVQLRNRIMAQVTSMLKVVQVPSRSIFQQVPKIERLADNLFVICDDVVRNFTDPAILETAFLERAIIHRRKAEIDLGVNLSASYHGVHMVSEVQLESPADLCGKIDAGDEIIQINGQTVVGWDLRNVIRLLTDAEGIGELLLLLKKRPRDPLTASSAATVLVGGTHARPTPTARRKAKKQADTSTLTAVTPGGVTDVEPASPAARMLLVGGGGSRKERKRSSSFSAPKTPTAKDAPTPGVKDSPAFPLTTGGGGETVTWRRPPPPLVKQTTVVGDVHDELTRMTSYAAAWLDATGRTASPVYSRRQRRASISGDRPTPNSIGGGQPLDEASDDWFLLRSPTIVGVGGDRSAAAGGIDSKQRRSRASGGRRKLCRPAPAHYRQSYVNRELVTPEDLVGDARLTREFELTGAEEDTEDEDDVFVHTDVDEEGHRKSLMSRTESPTEYAMIEVADIDLADMNTDDTAEWSSNLSHATEDDEVHHAPHRTASAAIPTSSRTYNSLGDASSSPPSDDALRTPGGGQLSAFSHMSVNSQQKLFHFFGEVPTTPSAVMTTSDLGPVTSSSSSEVAGGEPAEGGVTLTRLRPVPSAFRHQRGRRVDMDTLHPSSSVRIRRFDDTVSKLESACRIAVPAIDPATITKAGWLSLYRGTTPPRKGDKKWTREYLLVRDSLLFLFSSPTSLCADGVIRIPSFTIRPSNREESSIKKHMFKVENPRRCFYFSCGSRDEMIEWMNKLGLAAIHYGQTEQSTGASAGHGDYYLSSESRAPPPVAENPYGTLPRYQPPSSRSSRFIE